MAAKLFLLIGGLVTLCASASVEERSTCNCYVDHPQQKFCEADFAFVGTVMSSEDLSDFFVYAVTISDEQIFKGLTYIGVGVTEVTVYTPYGTKLCGIPNLLYKEEYLFTGEYVEGQLVITLCNWVTTWEDVTIEQRIFLQDKEYLKHCSSCTVLGVKSELKKDQKEKTNGNYDGLVSKSGFWTPSGCYFNPVMSAFYESEDCESAYTYCHHVKDKHCEWKLTPEYKGCFGNREEMWVTKDSPRPAAALSQFTSLRDCKKLATKRMKKKCVQMVRQRRKNRNEDLEPKALLEELLDLRDLWLEIDDDEDNDFLME